MSLPGCCLSLASSSSAWLLMIRVPAQVACARVREMTILGMVLIAFATSGSDSSPGGRGPESGHVAASA